MRIDRAKRGTGKRKAVGVAEASEQHTARYTGILVCIEHSARGHRPEKRTPKLQRPLSRKHVRQDEPDHPGYEVETQNYF